MKEIAIIGGIGSGSQFSAELIKALLNSDYHVVAIARSEQGKQAITEQFANQQDVEFVWGDLSSTDFMNGLVKQLSEKGEISVYIHNAVKLLFSPFLDLTQEDFTSTFHSTVVTAVNVSQVLIPEFVKRGKGTLVFTGATASIKGNAKSAAFATSKFALRALSQSLAREFGSQGIHVAHVIADGVFVGERAQNVFKMDEGVCIKPQALAKTYLDLINQDPSCWTQELDIRPASEKF